MAIILIFLSVRLIDYIPVYISDLVIIKFTILYNKFLIVI